MDVLLLIVLILMPVFFIFVNIRILNFYMHPTEKNNSLVGKIIIVSYILVLRLRVLQ